LDIKSKRFSVFLKSIIILLSVVLVASGTRLVVSVVNACESYNLGIEDFENKPINKKVSDSAELSSKIYSDINYLDKIIRIKNTHVVKKALEKKQSDFVASVISNFVTNQQVFNENYADNYNYEDYENNVYFNSEQFINYDDGVNEPISFIVGIYESDNIRYDIDTEETAKEKINAVYEEFLNTDDFEYYAYIDDVVPSDSVLAIIDTKNGLKYESTDVKTDEKEYLSHEYAFVAKNGKVRCSKGFEGLFDTSVDQATGKSTAFNEDYEYYFYVEPESTAYSGYTASIQNAEQTANVNLLSNTVKAVVLFLVAIILAIISFVICSNKDENGKVKRLFLDYIPTDLHLVITVGLQFCLIWLFTIIYDCIIYYAYPFENYLYLALYVVAAAVWALLIELVTSVIRVCKSDKKFYENLLTYHIFKFIIAKPIRFFADLLKFRPANFSKLVRRWSLVFASLNLLFVALIVACAVMNRVYELSVAFLVCICIDTAAFVYALKYLKLLDAIITAAQSRTVSDLDVEKLPLSLKALMNSINYTNNELVSAVDKAVKDERMRTELITNVSHDLKTPLTSIINYVELLKTCNISDDNANEYIAVLDDKAKKLKRLIEDLIEASKITSGIINIEPINLNLSELATQAVIEHQQEFTDNNLTLVFEGDRNAVNAYADGNKTFRIVENLLSNARKYSLEGTRVYADVYETDNFSVFEIKNTSSEPLNISPEELTQRFVRGDKSRTNEGNGLGLSIAENLCKAQNGCLKITIDGDLFKARVMLPKSSENI